MIIRLINILLVSVYSISVLANEANQKFDDIMHSHWQWTLEQNPTFATSLGVRDYDEQLSDPSIAHL